MLTVAIGVHGPRELYVIVIDSEKGLEGDKIIVDGDLEGTTDGGAGG